MVRRSAVGTVRETEATGTDRTTVCEQLEPAVRERRSASLTNASARIAGSGQTMFERLRALRRAVATGAGLSTPAFHDIYHPYLNAVWAYREAVRDELGGHAITPADFGWSKWDGRERCAHCGQHGADTPPEQP
ncbi:hypothetical protein ACFV99_05440 [Streptomyces sp. NPDC059944]|uniref:hypothetical protein n=1 Tax=unclassified Streptomyces TaxID=2593676 RepID=UPI003646CE6D